MIEYRYLFLSNYFNEMQECGGVDASDATAMFCSCNWQSSGGSREVDRYYGDWLVYKFCPQTKALKYIGTVRECVNVKANY